MILSLKQRLVRAPRDKELMRAGAALQQNQLDIAEPLLKARLKRDPYDVLAMRMLAELAGRLSRFADAERLLLRALDLTPDFAQARGNLAMVYYRTDRLTEALAELDMIAQDNPHDSDSLRAAILGRLGNFDEALALYEDMVVRLENQPKLWLSYGHLLKTVGRLDEGIAAYRRALTLAPGMGEAWWALANLKTVRFSNEDLAAMETVLSSSDVLDEDRFHLEFALGKAWEDRGDGARAFASYLSANRHRRALIQYEGASIRLASERAAVTFTSAWFAARHDFGCMDDAPIFIIGMPRAGSTLVEQILASHSMIEATDELPAIPILWNALGSDPLLACSALDAAAAWRLGEDYLARARLLRRSGRKKFIDKLPNNWRYIGFIKTILPRAHIIDVRRHPMSCGFSNFRQHYARGQHFAYDLTDFGRYYADYVMLTRALEKVVPGGIHRVIYERLIDDTEGEVRELLDFLGIEFEEACLAFHQSRRAVRTPSAEQVRQPIYRESTENWLPHEARLKPLRDALGDVLDHWDAQNSAIFGADY